MANAFETVREYAERLGLMVSRQDVDDQLLVVDAPQQGIHQLILDCEEGILVIEQVIADLPHADVETCRSLLQINRSIVHGALCLDDSGQRLIFRDTLALENLDFNELEGTVNALSLMLAEHAASFIKFAKQTGATA